MLPFFMQVEYTRPGFPPDPYGFSTEDRLQYGPLGIAYMLNREGIDFLGDQRLPGELCYPSQDDSCAMFNPLELRHMEDVKLVAQGIFVFGLGAAILALLGAAILARFAGIQALHRAIMQGGLLTIGLIVTIVLLAVTAWDLFFTAFHDVFFEPGTWQFFYSDTLIRLYPEQFWFDASLTVGVLTTIGALLLLGFSWRELSRKAQ
jgi:integral membrane protein (TIGR01906 family)